MIRKVFLWSVLILASIYSCGCAPLFIGAAVGGVGMYAASKDSIQGDSDKSYASIWDSAVRVAKAAGKITKENETLGIIEFDTIEASKVWVKVMHVTNYSTRLRVSARKYKLPNLTLAQDLFVKIIGDAGL